MKIVNLWSWVQSVTQAATHTVTTWKDWWQLLFTEPLYLSRHWNKTTSCGAYKNMFIFTSQSCLADCGSILPEWMKELLNLYWMLETWETEPKNVFFGGCSCFVCRYACVQLFLSRRVITFRLLAHVITGCVCVVCGHACVCTVLTESYASVVRLNWCLNYWW